MDIIAESAVQPLQQVGFSALSGACRTIWAKSGSPSHSLLAHMLDVAAVSEVLLETESEMTLRWAAAALGVEQAVAARWIAALAGLHDFGKAIAGFQQKYPEGMLADEQQGLDFPLSTCRVTRHDHATAALLPQALQRLQVGSPMWLTHVSLAVSAHHGLHILPVEINSARPLNESTAWAAARQEMLAVYWQVLAPRGEVELEDLTLPAVNWLAGLTSVADWIASNPEWFPLGNRGIDALSAYYQDACRRARQVLPQIRWQQFRPLLDTPETTHCLLNRIVRRPDMRPRPLQTAGDALLVSVSGPALMLIEAPMGEGKTEMAFLAHLRLQAANHHRGLYLALPTQATGNALFKRAMTFLDAFMRQPGDVQLIHGGASMNEDVIRLRGIDHGEGTLAASTWFSQRKRPLLSPYGVGTVDQALYAVLNVKHHFVRLWGLANRVVVLDEIHAYDTYTTGLITALLRWLKAMGSSVVLMSATLPSGLRNELLAAWGVSETRIPSLTYPRVLLADDQGVRGDSFKARDLPQMQLHGVGVGLDEIAEKALSLLQGDGCGAVIVNTVDRAQRLYALLCDRMTDGTRLLLFHARFPMDERARRESEVLDAFGTSGTRPHRALLIATQVAEQSLDLDFDFMISDLAPVDLLLQRAGRLHRHYRLRPAAHVNARFWVAGLGGGFPDLKETAWGFVYDPYILGRTWVLLNHEHLLQLPQDIDRLVQAVYGDAAMPADLDQNIQRFIEVEAYGAYRARINKERSESRNAAIDPDEEAHAAYNNLPRGNEQNDLLGLRNVTRLGRETVTLVPVDRGEQGWRVGEMLFDPTRPVDDATARALYRRQVRVARRPVVEHFKQQVSPAAFADHPLLRDLHPLPLHQGRFAEGGVMLRLDVELGLVYEGEDAIGEVRH